MEGPNQASRRGRDARISPADVPGGPRQKPGGTGESRKRHAVCVRLRRLGTAQRHPPGRCRPALLVQQPTIRPTGGKIADGTDVVSSGTARRLTSSQSEDHLQRTGRRNFGDAADAQHTGRRRRGVGGAARKQPDDAGSPFGRKGDAKQSRLDSRHPTQHDRRNDHQAGRQTPVRRGRSHLHRRRANPIRRHLHHGTRALLATHRAAGPAHRADRRGHPRFHQSDLG